MNHCHIILDLLPLYIEDLVSPETADFVQAHLNTCPQCKTVWEQMSCPTHKPTSSNKEWKAALKKERRKNLFRNTTLWILAFLLTLSLGAGYGIYRYYDKNYRAIPLVEVNIDPQDILSLCPEVIPSAQELDFTEDYRLLSTLPSEQRILSPEEYLPFTEGLVPYGATIGDVLGSQIQLTIDYFYGDQRIIVVYPDHNLDGYVDELAKYVSYRYKEIGDPFYEAVYDTATRTTRYIRLEHLP